MRLVDGILELFAPTRCAGCDLPGALLCPTCDAGLPRITAEHACPRCGAPYGMLTCTECWDRTLAFDAAAALGELDAGLARAVVLHKDAGERRLGGLLGGLLGEVVAERWAGWAQAVTFVPATREAVLRRGFDHAAGLAAPVAESLGVPLLTALGRSRAVDQRALGRTARAENAAGTFSARGALPARVVLVDDVMTTGATLEAATDALLGAGVERVRCAVVARAW